MRDPRHDGERGETSIQSVLVFPVLLTILFMGVHVAAYARGSQVAGVAATRGAQVAASRGNDADGAWATLRQIDEIVADLGFETVASPRIEIDARAARVTVSLPIERIVPFLPGTVTRSAEVPREIFLRQQDR